MHASGAAAEGNSECSPMEGNTDSLAGNQIGDAGAKAIAAALQKNTTIIKLVYASYLY